jgi:hypothetical protein
MEAILAAAQPHGAIGAPRVGYAIAMRAPFDPGPAPPHQCLNVLCGCDDLVSAGPCSEWCAAHTLEAAEVDRGVRPASLWCGCGHEICTLHRTGQECGSAGLS